MRLFTSARPWATLIFAAGLIAAAGCSTTAESADQSAQVTLIDGWVKATDEDMTSVFGVLHNDGSDSATLSSAESPDADLVELHTIVEDDKGNQVMTAVDDGFTIEPGGDFTMEPGAEHIMLMDLTAALEPGQDIEVLLTYGDGSTMTVSVPAKEFSGAEANYDHDHDEGDN